LWALENTFPGAAAAVAPVAEVGDDRSGLFQTYRHCERMMSLDKTYAEADLRAFLARLAKQLGREDLEYVVEPKFDGLSVSVTYEKGRLVRAVTRGNGLEGDDITANALMIRRLPRLLREAAESRAANPVPDVVELRGEIYLLGEKREDQFPFKRFDDGWRFGPLTESDAEQLLAMLDPATGLPNLPRP
jgi:DNA ligase (NAD+)